MATRSRIEPPHPVTGTSQQRRAYIGQSVHRGITRLAVESHPGTRPDYRKVAETVHPDFAGYPTSSVRGAKVDVIASVRIWVAFQWAPNDWELIGVEADDSPGGRPDLWWRAGDGLVVGDEIKTGADVGWQRQIDAQVAHGLKRFHHRFAGIRLFNTESRDTSRWISPSGERTPLNASPFWFPEHQESIR
jgi:hypothetical protein